VTAAGLRAALLFVPFVVKALALTALYVPARRLGRHRFADRLQLAFHRAAVHWLNIRVTVRGRPTPARPLLIAANHASWVDIFILSSVLPVSFIAKSEVAGWPVAGTLARLQRSVFVERAERGKVREQASAIADRLAGGDAIVLFAEGTTSDGNFLKPFRSALFGAARAALGTDAPEVMVQPVAIVYTALEGLPLGRSGRRLLSWIGDEDLLPHLRQLLSAGSFDVSVLFGEPIAYGPATDRKAVAAEAEARVRRLFAAELRGDDPCLVSPDPAGSL
jgi:1-acyl-sn-glycerol-3-phosphate acyltransferase